MATTFEIRPIAPVYARDGYAYRTWPLASAQTFKAGAAIVQSSGEFSEAGTNPAAIVGFATAAADDYAWKEDTFGTVVPSVPVALANQEFRGTLATGSGNYTAADVSAQIGATYGLTKHSVAGVWVVDQAKTTTNARVQITGVDQEAADGDINIPVTFVVLPDNRDVVD